MNKVIFIVKTTDRWMDLEQVNYRVKIVPESVIRQLYFFDEQKDYESLRQHICNEMVNSEVFNNENEAVTQAGALFVKNHMQYEIRMLDCSAYSYC